MYQWVQRRILSEIEGVEEEGAEIRIIDTERIEDVSRNEENNSEFHK